MIHNNNLKYTYWYYCCVLILLCYSVLFSSGVYATQWKNNIGIGADLSSYDNITLAPEGNEKSDVVAQIRPFIMSQRTGGRTSVDLKYQMQIIKYKENKQSDNIYHQLFFNLKSELAKELFFIDARVTNFQSLISGIGSIPQDNVSISNNRANVSTFLFSPYIDTKVSNNTYMLLRYTINKTRYSDITSENQDRINQSVLVDIKNTENSSNFGWKFRYTNNKFDSNLYEGRTNKYEQASMDLRLQKSKQLIPYVTLGYERNDIQNTIYNKGGDFWMVGIEWLPTRHTTISAQKGKRFYGDTSQFGWKTKSKWFSIALVYNESVTNTSNVFNSQPPANELTPTVDGEIQPIRANPFIRKRLSSYFGYKKGKSTVTWSLYDEKRLSLVNDGNDRTSGTTVIWDLLIGRLTTSRIRGSWNKIFQENIGIENRLTNISYTISKQTRSGKSRIISSLSLTHRRQDSDMAISNYNQNILTARANIIF